jgi:hypothetical protein
MLLGVFSYFLAAQFSLKWDEGRTQRTFFIITIIALISDLVFSGIIYSDAEQFTFFTCLISCTLAFILYFICSIIIIVDIAKMELLRHKRKTYAVLTAFVMIFQYFT